MRKQAILQTGEEIDRDTVVKGDFCLSMTG